MPTKQQTLDTCGLRADLRLTIQVSRPHRVQGRDSIQRHRLRLLSDVDDYCLGGLVS